MRPVQPAAVAPAPRTRPHPAVLQPGLPAEGLPATRRTRLRNHRRPAPPPAANPAPGSPATPGPKFTTTVGPNHLTTLTARPRRAWVRRNWRQVGPERRGRGSNPAVCRICQTVETAIWWILPGVRDRELAQLTGVVRRLGPPRSPVGSGQTGGAPAAYALVVPLTAATYPPAACLQPSRKRCCRPNPHRRASAGLEEADEYAGRFIGCARVKIVSDAAGAQSGHATRPGRQVSSGHCYQWPWPG